MILVSGLSEVHPVSRLVLRLPSLVSAVAASGWECKAQLQVCARMRWGRHDLAGWWVSWGVSAYWQAMWAR